MELQKVNSVSLGGIKDSKGSDMMDEDDYQSQMKKIIGRLTTSGPSSKPERGHVTSVTFEMSILTIFFGLSNGRVGMLLRDPLKYGNIDDVLIE
jgi:hypothetical protein